MAGWTFLIFAIIYIAGSEFFFPLMVIWLIGIVIGVFIRAAPSFGWFLIGIFNGLTGR